MNQLRLLLAPLLLTVLIASGGQARADDPTTTVDLATLATDSGDLLRVYGSINDGFQGVPIAGGFDCDEDQNRFVDYAMAAFRASPMGRNLAGEIYLRFGTGSISGAIDTAGFPAMAPAPLLKIAGDQIQEVAGSEIWMDDVTGDQVGDLLIARQNYTPGAGRIGAGALTILVGGAELRSYADTLQYLDLRSPPMTVTITNIVGALEQDRLGIWVRTGDVDGDGTADIVVGADQVDVAEAGQPNETHRGALYVIRGGSHLDANQTVDLANFPAANGGTLLAGHIARVTPPTGSSEYHFGATVQIGDLDGNGRADVLGAATLNRSGASIAPLNAPGPTHATGGSSTFGNTGNGTVYIAWDDNFPMTAWAPGYSFEVTAAPGTHSSIDGGVLNRFFGEELLAGLDYDDDGNADLFVGDITGADPARGNAGRGHVLYNAALLAGLDFDFDTPPMGLQVTTFRGGEAGDIATDTAMHGDFDGDGFDDLAFSSPHASPLSRNDAGTIHVFHGQNGLWPALIDLAPGMLPDPAQIRISEIYGANGSAGSDAGDTLCYSAAAGDVDGDGRTDFITNEMVGNGLLPSAEDAGNLIVVSGALTAVPEPATRTLLPWALASTLLLRRLRRAAR